VTCSAPIDVTLQHSSHATVYEEPAAAVVETAQAAELPVEEHEEDIDTLLDAIAVENRRHTSAEAVDDALIDFLLEDV